MSVRIPAPRGGNASLILLHGLGAGPDAVKFLVHEFHRRPSLDHVNIVVPQAPSGPVTAKNGETVPRWFDVKNSGAEAPEDYTNDRAGLSEAVAYVEKLIKEELDQGVSCSRIVVGGFSSGAALTMAVAATLKFKVAGFIALSGFIPVPDYLESIASSSNLHTPFLVTHGTSDDEVTFKAGKASLRLLRKKLGFTKIEFQQFDGMLHNIDPDCLTLVTKFVEGVLE